MRAWILLSFVVAAVCSYAQSTGPFCSVPAGGAPMPHYFYSTNNHISGNAMVGPTDERGPRYFVYACLKVGGYIVDEYIHILGEPQPMSIGGQATFDSTVFGNGTQLVVRFEAVDSYGVVYEAQDSAPVKNKIGLAQVDEWNGYSNTDGIEETRLAMQNLGWDTHELSTADWDPVDLRTLFTGSGIYHVATHGLITQHLTDNWDDVLAEPDLLFPYFPNYVDWRASINGNGYPPHNSTDIPPVTFAFLDACHAGTTNAFNSILLPHMTSYGEFVENMCLIGYWGSVFVAGHSSAAKLLFSDMREGVTAWNARAYFLYANWQRWIANNDDLHVVRIDSWDNVVNADYEMRLWGDPNTRIRWVYTGDEYLADEGWFR